ncbi:hypothetical protein Ga0609869_000403 [Rhodovulum iodosum]|uniref:Uncharacterized protein n=1 Tax=Rhodovulum iodosum TaxID=68291 RepID=A0ABV3XNZ8_9RHOB|nr:hypothetical protein [Rhodovulum robiginosum]RSK37991.1 hypothetical protein EJA01_03430 [Rhodovulum robiginosum]
MQDLITENRRVFDGMIPYSLVAFFAYLLMVFVLFADQVVPYCERTFAQPGQCEPIFTTIFPIAVAAVIAAPVLRGAVMWLGGNRTVGFLFALAVILLPPLMVGWHTLV